MLTRASGSCKQLLGIVEEIAHRRCASISRHQLADPPPWRRGLGYLYPKAKLAQRLTGHTTAVTCVVELADGHVLSGSRGGSLRVWDIATSSCAQQLLGHTDAVRIVSCSFDKSLRVWDIATGECMQQLLGHSGPVYCATELDPGRRVVSSSSNNTLRVWDFLTGHCVQLLVGHTGPVACVAQLSRGRVVSGGFGKSLRVWDILTGECK